MARSARLHKMMEQTTRLNDDDLLVLDDHIHALIAQRERAALEPIPIKEGREPVQERQAGRWTLQLEFVKCGKEKCHCAQDRGHGPYWYAYSKHRGRVISKYVGKDADRFNLS